MADKSIGIKLDVRQTGLQQVDESLISITKTLKEIDNPVNKKDTGWGSTSHTKEMQDQLRYLQQIADVQARISRMNVPSGSSNSNSPSPSLPPRSQNHASGGGVSSLDFSKLTSAIGKIGSVLAGVSILSTIASSLARGDQLSSGYGDISKRMGGASNGGLNYAKNMTRGLNGYGFDDMQALSATNSYSQVTGRMNPSELANQMKTILGTGRRFGMSDPTAITNSFAGAFSSGVTGGSQAQMNPQDFAKLLANAISDGRMQGKEGQLLQQIAQVTQMSVQSMGTAGDEKTIAALLSMGNKSGNQALIANLPSMMSNISGGISTPSGYGMQSMMIRAIGGGKMNLFDEKILQSKGALGRETDANGKEFGQTNIEKTTNYLMKSFSGDPARQAWMLSQAYNITPTQAQQYIKTYTKNGKFDSAQLNQLTAGATATPSAVSSTDTDAYRNQQQNKQTGADLGTGLFSVPVRSAISNAVGDVLGSPVGSALAVGGLGLMGANSMYSGYKMLKGGYNFFKGGSKAISAGASVTSAGAESVAGGIEGSAEGLSRSTKVVSELSKTTTILGDAGKILGKVAIPLAIGSSIFDIATAKNKPKAIAENGAGLAGMWGGAEAGAIGGAALGSIVPVLGTAIGGALGGLIGGALGYFGGKKVGGMAYNAVTSSSATASTDSTSGSNLAPIVISTILALQPYMSQIRSVLGGSDPAFSGVKSTSNYPSPSSARITSGLLKPNMSSGISLASLKTGGGGSSSVPSSISGSDAVSYYAKLYGVPDYIAYSIAQAESSMNPNDTYAESNGTTSTGLFALNSNGQGKGYSSQQLKDPMLNSKIGLGEIAKAYKQAKAKGIPEGAGMAQWVAEQSGHPGYGVHSQLDDKIRNNAQGILDGKINVGGTFNLNVTTDKGTKKVPIPITAKFTGIKTA